MEIYLFYIPTCVQMLRARCNGASWKSIVNDEYSIPNCNILLPISCDFNLWQHVFGFMYIQSYFQKQLSSEWPNSVANCFEVLGCIYLQLIQYTVTCRIRFFKQMRVQKLLKTLKYRMCLKREKAHFNAVVNKYVLLYSCLTSLRIL